MIVGVAWILATITMGAKLQEERASIACVQSSNLFLLSREKIRK